MFLQEEVKFKREKTTYESSVTEDRNHFILNEKEFNLRNLGVYKIMERAEAVFPNLGIVE